ncbi:beta strand repeat-containing protein [Flavobacterium sp. 3HN19-14]|uniref:beta strand repeat-containing protein n=1 Tax=Flavobacterium sp. 3HN19-14 TaxID=3448133 RepID=UPI003EE3B7AE
MSTSTTVPVSIAVQAANGTATVNTNGTPSQADDTITYVPNADFNGTDTFSYTITDSNGDTSTAVVTITVTPVNDLPLAANDSTFTNEDIPVTITVMGNDTFGGDGPAATDPVTIGTAPLHGAVVVNPDNTITYTPAANYNGNDSFTYTITDSNGDTSTATVTIVINPVNDVPLAANDTVSLPMNTNTVIAVLANDTFGGDWPNFGSIIVASQPSNGIATLNTNGTPTNPTDDTITYTPTTGYFGNDSFTYIIIDANGDTSTATVFITVTGQNAIVAADDVNPTTIISNIGNTNAFNVLSNDTINGVAVLASQVNISLTSVLPTGISFSTATGVVGVAPGTPAGVYTFTYSICEVSNPTNCDPATVTITVQAANTIIANNDTPAPVNGATGGTAVNVLDNDTLNGVAVTPSQVTITATTPVPAGITFDTATGVVTVQPNTPAGTYTFDYSICEVLNPTNCDTGTVTVVVSAPAIIANNDTPAPVNGATGGTAVNVLDNDTLNGVPVAPSQVTITATTPVPAGITFDTATGIVTVQPNTPAGSYIFDYSICEVLNPTNCDTGTVTVVVNAPAIIANNDTPAPVNGATGGTAVNVLDNDTLNGVPVAPSQVTITATTPVPAGITFDTATGVVTVQPNTPAGTYTFDYSICEVLNPTNCDTGTVTVVVTPPAIIANNDTPAPVNGLTGGTAVNVLDNDTLNGVAVAPSQVTITATTPVPAGITFDTATGIVTVQPNTPAGTYTFDYSICEVLNPTNCDTGTVTVVVNAPAIIANNDTPAPVNGATGGTAVNVLDNDTLNGVAVTPSQVTITATTPVPAGITFDTATGIVTVQPNTPVGTYTFDYSICEVLNPTNCDTGTVTVVVTPPAIIANVDNPAPVNGADGNPGTDQCVG